MDKNSTAERTKYYSSAEHDASTRGTPLGLSTCCSQMDIRCSREDIYCERPSRPVSDWSTGSLRRLAVCAPETQAVYLGVRLVLAATRAETSSASPGTRQGLMTVIPRMDIGHAQKRAFLPPARASRSQPTDQGRLGSVTRPRPDMHCRQSPRSSAIARRHQTTWHQTGRCERHVRVSRGSHESLPAAAENSLSHRSPEWTT